MKIAIMGAGPSGLFLAILLKQGLKSVDIQVYEQNPRDATFGFGVVLADTGLANLQAAAPDVCRKLIGAMRFSDKHTVSTRDHPVVIQRPGQGGGAIPRIALLSILQEQAEALGIEVAYDTRCTDYDRLDADLIVGADGVNSNLREAHGTAFGASRYYLSNHFAWYGVGKAFPNPALVFRKYRGGYFVAHYYPYSESMSTFVAECDHRSWQELGMEAMSEDARKSLFEEVYAPELDGHALISNNSSWRQFPVVRAENWYADNKVLVGDALNSAHFSIGSGTRIAMEDSIALAHALQACTTDLPAALQRYVRSRKPQKQKLIRASEASFNWYENVRNWMDAYTPYEFVLSFMTRTGRVDAARLRKQYPELVRQFAEAGIGQNGELPA
jgi:2-polyprenyl-6-methoxyphenol hydroxylase-like FAD-dependent oxidoreductase